MALQGQPSRISKIKFIWDILRPCTLRPYTHILGGMRPLRAILGVTNPRLLYIIVLMSLELSWDPKCPFTEWWHAAPTFSRGDACFLHLCFMGSVTTIIAEGTMFQFWHLKAPGITTRFSRNRNINDLLMSVVATVIMPILKTYRHDLSLESWARLLSAFVVGDSLRSFQIPNHPHPRSTSTLREVWHILAL